MRSLQAEIVAISDDRRTLLKDVHRIARLEEIAAETEPAAGELRKPTPEPEPAETNDESPEVRG